MNSVLSKLVVVSAMALMTQTAFAAERIMSGNVLLGGKGVSVGGQLYDVDLRPAAFDLQYPGPASPFSTQAQAEAALTAIYTQLIGNGEGMGPGSLLATGGYTGSPERKVFGIAQTFGDLTAPNQAMGVWASFVSSFVITGQDSAPWPISVTMSFDEPRLMTLPSSAHVDGGFAVWTLAAPVPEPAAVWMLVSGLAVAAWGARRRAR